MYEEWMGVVITGLLVVPACLALRTRPKGANSSGRAMPHRAPLKRFQERRKQGKRGVYDGVERRINHYFVETLGPFETPFENGIDPRTGQLRLDRSTSSEYVPVDERKQNGAGVDGRIGSA